MRKRAWTVTFSAVFAGIAIAIIQNKVVPCIGVLQEYFSISANSAGWLSSIFCIMGIVMAFPGAYIVNRLGLRMSGIISLLCGIVGTVLGLLSESVVVLMIGRVIEGMGVGLISIVVPSIISMWFPADRRGLPMSIWSTWQIVAQALCFFFGMTITSAFGWQGIWIAGGIVTAVSLAVFAIGVKLPEQSLDDEPEQEQISVLSGLKCRPVWMVCIAMMFFTLGNFAFVTWVATAWSEMFSLDVDLTNRYISIMFFWALPISVALGFVLDRVNHKKFCVISYFLYAFVAAASFCLPSAKWIIPYIVIYPLFESAVCAAMWTIVPETVKDKRNLPTAMALFTLLQNVGMLVGPPIAGSLKDGFGNGVIALPVLLSCLLGTGFVVITRVYTAKEQEN